MSDKVKVLDSSPEDLKEAVIHGAATGSKGVLSLSLPALIASTLATTDTMSLADQGLVKKMIQKVDKVNPGIIIKELLPTEHPNKWAKFLDKVVRRMEGSYRPSSSEIWGGNPEKFWGAGDDMLGRVRKVLGVPNRGKIITPGDTATFLHELGHAEHMAGQNKYDINTTRGYVPAAAMAGAAMLAGAGHSDLAPVVAASGMIPTLYQEAQATGRAVKHVYENRGTKSALKTLAKLTPAFLTYASLPIGIYYGVKAALGKLKSRNEDRAQKYHDMFEKKSHVIDGFLNKLDQLLRQ